jgi:hypothetical protein
MIGQCAVCGSDLCELREGTCFHCVEGESIIDEGLDMYDNGPSNEFNIPAQTPMEKLKFLVKKGFQYRNVENKLDTVQGVFSIIRYKSGIKVMLNDQLVWSSSDLDIIDGGNCCEHGDHPAPSGKRFCSPECDECEHSPHNDDGSCSGICNCSE